MPNCLTQNEANAVWEYRDGHLYWRERVNAHVAAGAKAGHLRKSDGYWHVAYKRKTYLLHRIVYLIHHGHTPRFIDHIDGNTLNNDIANLRPATLTQNMCNRRIGKNNTSGAKNVSRTASGKWQVRVRINEKTCFYALIEDFELAMLVASEARAKYHGNFARHQ